jgi:hypothetical protein
MRDSGEMGTGPICAKHPSGRSGKSNLSPFSLRPWAGGRLGAASTPIFISSSRIGCGGPIIQKIGRIGAIRTTGASQATRSVIPA